jgi:hypothetical protein
VEVYRDRDAWQPETNNLSTLISRYLPLVPLSFASRCVSALVATAVSAHFGILSRCEDATMSGVV